MAPLEGLLPFSVASLVEDVLQQHGSRPSDMDMASRKAEEAANRRYETVSWLRKMVGFLGTKDLPEKPTEEELRLGLRNGAILCHALNKVQPGAVPKVVENLDSAVLPDGAALSAYQYFENIRNFLDALQEKGIPAFEASDLGQGGKSARVVNCILALKSYSEWKQAGGIGSWKYGGNLKPVISGKSFTRKNLEPFMNTSSRNIYSNERFQVDQNFLGDLNEYPTEMTTSDSLNMLVQAVLSDRKPEEVPFVVESLLKRIVVEFERRVASQNDLVKTALKDINSDGTKSLVNRKVLAEIAVASDEDKEDENCIHQRKGACVMETSLPEEELKHKFAKQSSVFELQQRDIEELKHILCNTRAGMQTMQVKYMEDLGKHVTTLAHAASGYHRVLEENRKLYNQRSSTSTVGHLDDGNITIITPSKYGKEGRKSFSFNKVFGPSATQDEVYSDTEPLIRSVLDGYNVCIFAYGQTGSGKTYTMTGPKEITEQSEGVNFRALSDLFYLSEQRKNTSCYDISVQMIEIYNEQVRDLLVNTLEIRNNSQKGMNVPDANLVPVRSRSEVIELMNMGQRNRAVSATTMNDRSSRSHSCLTVHVQGRELTSGAVLRGCMHLVDLAGSERVYKSEVTGDRMKEAQHINKSLSALGDVIAALAQKNSHVPYRNSKLTQLLQDSLGGQAKTLMFVHVSPEPDAVGETISTLKFAERVSGVELGAARLNKESGDVKDLKDQIAQLKAALARKEAEPEHFESLMSTPGVHRTKVSTPLSKPTMSREHANHKLPMENSNSVARKKRPSFDLQEILPGTVSPPWPDNNSSSSSIQRGEENENDLGDWVDKVMVNRQESIVSDDNSLGDWDGEATRLPDLFYQRCLPDMKIYSDPLYNRNGISRQGSQDSRGFDIATTDSEEQDLARSDSSEADVLWQFNLSTKSTSVVTGSVSRIKKPPQKPAKSPDIRTPIQAHGPPSRKPLNGSSQPVNRRQPIPSPADGRRHLSTGKGRNVK
ncbi:hypothetical protein Taro_021923 [Colocasia esculenta]|uniref:Uncharacterized protein n=1 Tax=Colocasia esculenta TaxID=4460 RepID=A0A843V083_COLES|nr:hypothetical protein [Colocasia esculenta]